MDSMGIGLNVGVNEQYTLTHRHRSGWPRSREDRLALCTVAAHQVPSTSMLVECKPAGFFEVKPYLDIMLGLVTKRPVKSIKGSNNYIGQKVRSETEEFLVSHTHILLSNQLSCPDVLPNDITCQINGFCDRLLTSTLKRSFFRWTCPASYSHHRPSLSKPSRLDDPKLWGWDEVVPPAEH